MAEEENQIKENSSDDEEVEVLFGEICLMVDKLEVDSETATSGSTGEDVEVISNTDANLLAKFESSESEFIDHKARLKGERTLVNRFRINCGVYKTSHEDLDLNFSKVIKELEERETYLKTTLSKLKIEHETLISA